MACAPAWSMCETHSCTSICPTCRVYQPDLAAVFGVHQAQQNGVVQGECAGQPAVKMQSLLSASARLLMRLLYIVCTVTHVKICHSGHESRVCRPSE
eukprot:1161864-Pelagomonas_calceolata.AAC.12